MAQGFEQMPQQFYRLKDISRIVGLKRTSIYTLIERGALPLPLKIGRASLWPVEAVQELCNKIRSGELAGKSGN